MLGTDGGTAVGFALGVVELLARDDEDRPSAISAPTCSAPTGTPATPCADCSRDPDRPLNEALLDQRNLAGIGNLYANELCFISGRPPALAGRRRARPAAAGAARGRHCCEANRERTEQATTGDIRRGHTTWVYRRERAACRRCGTPIEVAMTGPAGRERATYWCPACQPG